MKEIYIAALLFFLPALVHGQYSIKGKAIDGKTSQPLAFVSLIVNNDTRSGTTTDIDGKFYFNSSVKIDQVTCSYIGYKTVTLTMDDVTGIDNLVIKLYAEAAELKEVIIKTSENPANRIIRQVIKNKDINNPEKVSSFKYKSYNKSIFDFINSDTARADSIKEKLNEVLQGGHLFLMESVTERKFIAPDKSEETIIATKVSGLKYPSFAPLATDVQPFSFYRDIFPLMNTNYLNPVSNGSLNKYKFFIEDTLYQGADTVFIISFKPKAGKNFEALTGLLYINTNKYAIQNVIAEPYEKTLVGLKLQQQYQFIDNKQWFPAQLNYEITFNLFSSSIKESALSGVRANGKSYIKDVELYAPLRKKDFSAESLVMNDSAAKRDTQFWSQNRPEILEQSEATTYRVIDSLGEKLKFDRIMKLAEKAAQGRIPVKFIDIDLTKTIVSNRFEGYRAGFGVLTNDKFSKWISVGGFAGYGLKDHRWKYGGEFAVFLNRKKEWELRGSYQNSVREAGKSGLKYFDRYNFIREAITERMDEIIQYSFAMRFRALKYAKIELSVNHSALRPLFAYEYEPANQPKITGYSSGDISVRLRYAYGEKIFRSGDQHMSLGTKYPVLYVAYTKGIKGFYDSHFDYNKLEARIDETFVLRNIGTTKIRIEGGVIDKPLPYGLLFTGEGSYRRFFSAYVAQNYFQTARPYEFLSDKYANLFLSHNFGSLLFSIKKFQPLIIIHQHIGWGTLSHPEYHKLASFVTKEKGFFESGLQIDNLIKLNYFNVLYLGLGVAAYYRYGPYAYPDTKDNIALRLTFNFSIK